jgi:hypothetical protein
MAHIYLFVICVIIILQLLLRLLSASPLYLGYRNLALPDAFHAEGLGRVSNFIKLLKYVIALITLLYSRLPRSRTLL